MQTAAMLLSANPPSCGSFRGEGVKLEGLTPPAKILIIDDEHSIVEQIRRILVQDGPREVASTTDPFAALALFRSFQPDIILLDLMMPGLSGLELLSQLRAEIPPEVYLPILVVTGCVSVEPRLGALRHGATDLLRKPFEAAELMLRVRNLLATRTLHLQLAMKQQELEADAERMKGVNDTLGAEIAARIQSEAALEKQREFLTVLLENLQDGIVACDAEGVLTLFNRATREFHQLPEEPIPAEEWAEHFDLFLADGTTRMSKAEIPLFRALQGECVRDVEMVIAPRNGGKRRTLLASGRAIANASGTTLGAVVVMHDITEHQHAQEALCAAKEAAEHANAAKSEFLSRMSHELRTPLNAILGFGQILEMDTRSAEDADSVQQVLQAGRHLLALVDEVLEVSRIEAGGLALSTEPVPLNEVLIEAGSLLRPLAERHDVTLHHANRTAHHVLADRQRLKQVVLNLLSNAIKYNRPGGTVTISVAEVPRERLRLAVRDTGPGISPLDLAKLFTPFERLGAATSAIEGIGLGLSISRQMLQLMGGTIGVESNPPEGSTFWVELPLVESPLERLERVTESAPNMPATSGSRRTVLYIEDNLSNLRLVERLLSLRPSVRLLPAMQGRLGLELGREHQPDLILLDLHLPDIDGDEVLEQLQCDERTAGIPVVMLSADATPRQIERLKAAGAFEYLTKPLNVRRFIAVLDEVLQQDTT